MNIAAIIGLGIAMALLLVGIENNQDGPVWLAILLIAAVCFTRFFVFLEGLVSSEIRKW